MRFPRQGWDLKSVLRFMVLVKILQPGGISILPSVSLNLGISGEMDPGPLLALKVWPFLVWHVSLEVKALEIEDVLGFLRGRHME